MSTLRELIEANRDKVPGLFARKIRSPGDRYIDGHHIEIITVDSNAVIFWNRQGHLREGLSWLSETDSGWELYAEPKRKRTVMMYPALWINSPNSFCVTNRLYPDEGSGRELLGKDFIRLLTDRGVEVEL